VSNWPYRFYIGLCTVFTQSTKPTKGIFRYRKTVTVFGYEKNAIGFNLENFKKMACLIYLQRINFKYKLSAINKLSPLIIFNRNFCYLELFPRTTETLFFFYCTKEGCSSNSEL
jgi:hypothetical protein